MFSTINRTEGWIADEFYFTVEWWDMVNYTTPKNVSLCLIPANITTDSGISNTYGIRKFLMQPTQETPNYSNPVEYHITLNFTDLNYIDSEVGEFHYYFEACTDTGNYTYRLYYNNDSSHADHVLVKPAGKIIAEISTIIYGGSSNVVYSESTLRYIIIISDFSGQGLSESPIVSFSNDKLSSEYNMTHYYTSSNGKEFRYYFDITGAKLMSGVIDVEFEFSENVEVIYGEGFLSKVFNFNYLRGALSTTIATIGLLGIVQLSLFNIIAILAQTAGEAAVGYILGLSLGAVALTAGIGGFSLYNYFANEDYGGLLGFSLGCFLLYIMLTTFISIDANSGFKVLGFITNNLKWIYIVQTIVVLAGGLLVSLFPNLDILGAVASFITSIFSVIPLLMGAYVAGISLTLICLIGSGRQKEGMSLSTGANIFVRSFEIYKKMILTGALVGFLLLMTSLGFGIAATYN